MTYGCLMAPEKHSDGNASKDIALRGLTHHTNIYKRKLTDIGDGNFVNTYELIKMNKDQSNGAVRMRGAETRLNGYSATVYRINGRGVAVTPGLNATTVINGRDITISKNNTDSYYKMDTTNIYYPYKVMKEAEAAMEKKYSK